MLDNTGLLSRFFDQLMCKLGWQGLLGNLKVRRNREPNQLCGDPVHRDLYWMSRNNLHSPVSRNSTSTDLTSLFLSATVGDMGRYRDELPNAAQYLNININLQGYWGGSAGPIEIICGNKIKGCSGYLGLFGFRYGWQPPGSEKSITHIEFEHAVAIWMERSSYPPIFLFLPAAGSAAASELKEQADQILAQEFAGDPEGIATSKLKQDNFKKEIAALARFINEFSTLEELKMRFAASVYHYRGEIWNNMAENPRQVPSMEIPADELGAIGRDAQMKAMNRVMQALNSRPDAPATCILVNGRDTSGLSEFIDHLSQWRGWSRALKVRDLRPSADDHDVIATWMLRELGHSNGGGGDPLDLLADCLARLCEKRHVVVFMRQSRGWDVSRFQEVFWSPLEARLRALWSSDRKHFTLVRALAREVRVTDAASATLCDANALQREWRKVLVLPSCADIEESDVFAWLSDKELDFERADAIAKSVVRDGTGTVDGTPLHVFARLREQNIWDEIVSEAG